METKPVIMHLLKARHPGCAHLIATQRSGLLHNECAKPCSENIIAGFSRNNPYPVPGNAILFTNTSSGASAYQWSVDGACDFQCGKIFLTLFTNQGKYKVITESFQCEIRPVMPSIRILSS